VGRSIQADAGERSKALPYVLKWAEAGAKLSGVDVIRGFNATMAIAHGGKTLLRSGLRDFAGVAGGEFRRRAGGAINDPEKPFDAHRLHRAVEHVGKSGGLDQRRL